MLPSELLAVWKRKGVIWPRYAKLSKDNLETAGNLIEVYRSHLGAKKRVVRQFVDDVEDEGYDYRFVRGLSFLLDRKSRFRCSEGIKAVDLRRKVYHATRELGVPTAAEERTRIIEAVASELGVTVGAVENFFYADLDDELILEGFNAPAPLELLQEYNLSLTQTLLFDSVEVRFRSSGNWQSVFYSIKRLGLIYEAYEEGGFWVKVDGPASLFKLTRRYGTAIAKLLPVIVTTPEWTVEAKILWKYTNEICDFKIESWKHNALLKKSDMATISFDSAVEEDFAVRFQALNSGWLLRREPEPVLAGRQVIIPDFSLEKEGVRVYLEIVGFWTAEYLLRKVEKLKKVEVNVLVAVNEALSCGKLSELEKYPTLRIIYYRDRIPLSPVIQHLEQAFKSVKAKQTDFIRDLQVVFTEPVVSFEEFGKRIGVSCEAVRTALTEKPPRDYVVMSNGLVRKDKLEQIGKAVAQQMNLKGRLSLPEAVRKIEADGVTDATDILKMLGYKIKWHGINSEEAEVVRAPAISQDSRGALSRISA